jgi:hypothetical protein
MLKDVNKLWNQALVLSEAGNYREANVLLREILTERVEPMMQLVCSRLIVREVMIGIKQQGKFPEAGTEQHDEICHYMGMAVESYALADTEAQVEAKEDIVRFRRILESMQPPNVTVRKYLEAGSLIKSGNRVDGLSLLKEVVAQSFPPEFRMIVAAETVMLTIKMYEDSGNAPSLSDDGTAGSDEFHRYLQITLESYERANPQAQSAFRERFDLSAFKELAGMKADIFNKKEAFKVISKDLFRLKDQLGEDRITIISNRQPVEDYVRRNSYRKHRTFSTSDSAVTAEAQSLARKHQHLLIVLNPEGEVFDLYTRG